MAFRLERQRLVFDADPPKQLEFIFTDDALTAGTGGPDVMRRQLEHLLRIIDERQDITVQVLDVAAANNPARAGGLMLLHFDERTPSVGLLPVVYGPSTYLDEPADTAALARGFDRVRELAFSREESRKRIDEALRGA